jgi:hypothetical protein
MSYYDPYEDADLRVLGPVFIKVAGIILLVMALVQWLATSVDASTSYRITSGMISATPEELEKCQFGLANDTALLFRPGSIPCALMKTLHGRKVDLWFTIVE